MPPTFPRAIPPLSSPITGRPLKPSQRHFLAALLLGQKLKWELRVSVNLGINESPISLLPPFSLNSHLPSHLTPRCPRQSRAPSMANHHPQPPSPGALHLHHGLQGGHPQVNGHLPIQAHHKINTGHLTSLNEIVWMGIGKPLPSISISLGFVRLTPPPRELRRAHGHARRCSQCLRSCAPAQRSLNPRDECNFVHPPHERGFPPRRRVSPEDPDVRPNQR